MARPMIMAVSRIGAARATAWNIMLLISSMANSGFMFSSSSKTQHNRTHHEVPSVHQDEQEDLQWQRDGHRGHHHHAHAHQDGGYDQVDEDERHEEQETHLESRAQFADDEPGDDRLQR